MRKQSVRAPRVRYTELEEQELVEMLHEGDDLLRLLKERGFICVEGKVTFAPYRLMLDLEEEGIEYQGLMICIRIHTASSACRTSSMTAS
ncbi:hypothetical protein [Exiguobacterium acetylicum]|uniref:hypothetical protein n=1 Tax=Exiguobacterium acetylicum TaxID=41170 RepID=UPI00068056CA|nr:hypothetical protein [Exiguobacterium acetylicum]KNH32450.1 hypothetical protein ACS74_14205 [Exiguobacterium acetylicum]